MIVTKFIELVFCSSDSKAQTNLHAGSLSPLSFFLKIANSFGNHISRTNTFYKHINI